MPAYRYDQTSNPYAQSIGELLAREGDPSARAAEVGAAARARALGVSGQAYGRMAEQIGQIPAQLTAAKDADQARQMRGLEFARAQAQQKAGALISQHMTTTADGHLSYDIDGFLKAAQQDPLVAPVAAEHADAMQKANDTYQTYKEGRFATKQAAIQSIYAKAGEAGGDPDDLKVIALPFVTSKVLDEGDLAPMYERLLKNTDPRARVMLLNAAAGVKPEYKEVGKGGSLVQTMPGAAPSTVMTNQDAPTAEEANIDAYVGSLKLPNGTTWEKLSPDQKAAYPTWKASQAPTDKQTKSVLLDGRPAEVVFDPKAAKYTLPATGEDVSARVKPIPTAAQVSINAGTLSDAALDQQTDKYLLTGELPSGMGAAGVIQRTAIMNNAAKRDPNAALARNKAVYKADTANLTNLQKTEGMLSAFESTAGKNLDQFLTLAEKIPDTGVPWLNTPVRMLDAKLVGSANIAAINAARDVALREIARVTNDPKLSGALTDSARAEVMGLNPQNATLPQIKAVAKVLKQDMANVHKGVNDEIDAVKNSIGSNPAKEAAPKTVKMRAPNGQTQDVPADQVDHYKSLGATVAP